MKKIYKKIAKKNGVSVREVERDMREAIEAAYADPNFYAGCVVRKDNIPTPEELIQHIANRVKALEDTESHK